MIQLRGISLSFNTQTIFDSISGHFKSDQRIGVVGRNGTGKSTLLKIIAGQLAPDGGQVSIEKYTKIAYMPQEVVLTSEKSVYDEAFSVFDEFNKLEKERQELEDILATPACTEHTVERYAVLQEKLSLFDKQAAEKKTEQILAGLGFSKAMLEQPVNQLSVGWKMRVVLAQLLLQDADFYLFDEPTNHLDLNTKQWFFEFLAQARFGFLLVSHDRYYLEEACDTILELERGNANLFNGNFSYYLTQKEQQRAVTQSAYERQQKEIARKQETIERFRASATKAKMAQSMIKQLDKVERIEIEPIMPTIRLTFPQADRSGAMVLSLKDIKHAFDGKLLFEHVTADIQRGEKVALIAPNGTGKTTLFNIIANKYVLQQGNISIGTNVRSALFEQDQLQVLKPNNTVYQEVLDACPAVTEASIRTFLGSFLFSGDDIYKKIKVLSGGERNRVAMVKVLLQKANFLLLDEPTNHLDLYAKEVLLQALQQYNGTMLLVSHDHDFINKLATHILELTPTGLYSYPGNYDEYREFKQQNGQDAQQKNGLYAGDKDAQKAATGQMSEANLRKELSVAERTIAQLEKESMKINELFCEYEYGTPDYNKAVTKLEAVQKSLKEATAQWDSIVQKLEVKS